MSLLWDLTKFAVGSDTILLIRKVLCNNKRDETFTD